MTLGKRLLQARLACGLSQRQAAGERLTRNMLSKLENDQALPSLPALRYLAEVYGVSAGALLDGPAEDAARARALFAGKEYEACRKALPGAERADAEQALLGVRANLRLAAQALENEDFAQARARAEEGLAYHSAGLYSLGEERLALTALLARTALEQSPQTAEPALAACREAYRSCPAEARYRMLCARTELSAHRPERAERELLAIRELPETLRAEHLLLRAEIALQREKYEAALLCVRQAQELRPEGRLLQRELYRLGERCSRELQDYKLAYEYAAKQLSLAKREEP